MNGYEYFYGAFGGMTYTNFVIWKNNSNLIEKDRTKLIEWLKKQHFCGEVLIGDLEEINSIDIRNDFYGDSFTVNNRTNNDHVDAKKHWKKLEVMIKNSSLKKKKE